MCLTVAAAKEEEKHVTLNYNVNVAGMCVRACVAVVVAVGVD